MGPLKLSTLISEKDIAKRVQEIGVSLTDKFKNQKLVVVCVLKGSFMFYADLIREINTDIICEFMGVSSYGNSTHSSGEVKLTMDLSTSIEDKNVLLVEDIVDTGLTMSYLQLHLNARKPKSLTSAALLLKPDMLRTKANLDHIGFKISNNFVVGYGLDYQGQYRNLPYIAQVENLN